MLIFSGNQLTISAGIVTSFTTTNEEANFPCQTFGGNSFAAQAFGRNLTSPRKVSTKLNYTDCLFIFVRIKQVIMDTKLTLKLNQRIIEKAKEYASNKKMSLSRIIEAYLQSLTTENDISEFEISPFVKSIATGTEIPADLDYKKDYSDYLMEKYK